MLHVQQYLTDGGTLEGLQRDLAIEVRRDGQLNVVSLNYNQIASPMYNRIVQECRSLILEEGSWRVMSWPFGKFFNLGEGHVPADFDWSHFKTYEKIDGSLIHFWCHPAQGWQVATRSVPSANTPLFDSGKTFRELVVQTLLDMGFGSFDNFVRGLDPARCFTFELTSPENQVVIPYTERRLTLLAIRVLATLKEEDPHAWLAVHPEMKPLQAVRLYEGFSLDAVKDACAQIDPSKQEGFVLVDSNYRRVKVKSEAYCLLAHQRDGLGKSNRARLELILTDKDDDVVGMLPEFVVDKIRQLKGRLQTVIRETDAEYEALTAELPANATQKDFALLVQRKTKNAAPHFMRRAGRIVSSLDYFKKIPARAALEHLKVREEDETDGTE